MVFSPGRPASGREPVDDVERRIAHADAPAVRTRVEVEGAGHVVGPDMEAVEPRHEAVALGETVRTSPSERERTTVQDAHRGPDPTVPVTATVEKQGKLRWQRRVLLNDQDTSSLDRRDSRRECDHASPMFRRTGDG
jgi:hypothetical protein